jgi:hypothetical protein
MTNAKPYLNNDQLHVDDCKELVISNIAHTTLHTLKWAFTLSNVLHVPQIKNQLLSIQQFCHENGLFWIHFSVSFYVKVHITKKVLFFFVRVKMTIMSFQSLPQCLCLKPFGLLACLFLLMSGIINLVTQVHVFRVS